MAQFTPEQHDRRIRREQLRRQRQRRQRLLYLRLAAAGVVLLLCGGLIFFLSRNPAPAAETISTVPATTGATGATTAPATQPPEESPTSVMHFAAAGDLVVCDEVVAAGGDNLDFHNAFLDVLPLLADADLTAVNFEGNLIGAPYGTATSSAPQQILTALADAGVDLLQVANSSTIANGLTGLNSTLQAIRSAGLEPLGAYATNREANDAGGYTIREVNGIRVGLVAFTKGMNSMALPQGSDRCVNLLYTDYATTYQTVDEDGIRRVLNNLAEESPDVVIALVHWGSEYNDMRSDSQETIRDLMLEMGVDVIIGTHPHYVQSVEFDPEAGTLVCYSLGDFFSSATAAGTNYSVVLNVEITKDNETGETRVTGYETTPIYTRRDGENNRVVRLDSAIAEYESNFVGMPDSATYSNMVYAAQRIAERLEP